MYSIEDSHLLCFSTRISTIWQLSRRLNHNCWLHVCEISSMLLLLVLYAGHILFTINSFRIKYSRHRENVKFSILRPLDKNNFRRKVFSTWTLRMFTNNATRKKCFGRSRESSGICRNLARLRQKTEERTDWGGPKDRKSSAGK